MVYLQLRREDRVDKEAERADKEGDGAEQVAILVHPDGLHKQQQPVCTTPRTHLREGCRKKAISLIIYSYHSDAMLLSMFLYFSTATTFWYS